MADQAVVPAKENVSQPSGAASPQLQEGVSNFLSKMAKKEPAPEAKKVEAVVPPVAEPVKVDPPVPAPENDKEEPPAEAALSLSFGEEAPPPEEAKLPPVEVKGEESRTQSIKYFKGQLSEKEKRLKELEAENIQLKTVRKTPEELGEALAELQMDPEYQQKYIQQPQQIFDSACRIAADYGVDAENLKGAINQKGFKALNDYLSTQIDDADARNVVRAHIYQIQQIYETRKQVDSKPFDFVQKIVERRQADEVRQKQAIESEYEENAEIGWELALGVVQKQKTNLPELVKSDTDDAWNEKVVTPTLANASKVFNDSLRDHRATGGRLTQAMAQRLSTLSQAYSALGAKIARANALEKENRELKTEMERLRGAARPSANMSRNAPPAQNGTGEKKTLNDAVGDFLGKMANRG